jgi:hypothetical protein
VILNRGRITVIKCTNYADTMISNGVRFEGLDECLAQHFAVVLNLLFHEIFLGFGCNEVRECGSHVNQISSSC